MLSAIDWDAMEVFWPKALSTEVILPVVKSTVAFGGASAKPEAVMLVILSIMCPPTLSSL